MTSYTPTTYTGDGATTDYSFSWDYIDDDHVHVYVDGTEVSYEMISTGLVRCVSAPANATQVEIRRITPASPLLVTWNDGSVILGSDLTKASKQAIYRAEEASIERTIILNWRGAWADTTDYEENEGVSNDGASYICTEAHTASSSTEPGTGASWADYWDLLASKGDTGPSGPGTGDMLASVYDAAGITEQLVGLTATQTLSGKTLTSPTINSPNISSPTITNGSASGLTLTSPALGADSVDAITEIAAALKTGDDTKLVTGTAGGAFQLAAWNADGDLAVAYTFATAASYTNATSSRVLRTEHVWDAMAEVTLTDGANISLNMNSGFDFKVTLGGNRTLDNPTNHIVGKKGRLRVIQDGTGGHTLSFGSHYIFPGGTAPTLTTDANAEDWLYYDVLSSTVVAIYPNLDMQ